MLVISFYDTTFVAFQAGDSLENIEIQNTRVRTTDSVIQALGGFMIVKNITQNQLACCGFSIMLIIGRSFLLYFFLNSTR